MIKQTVLPFKLETTEDLITSHAGLGLVGEFTAVLGLNKALDRYLLDPGSGAGYLASEKRGTKNAFPPSRERLLSRSSCLLKNKYAISAV